MARTLSLLAAVLVLLVPRVAVADWSTQKGVRVDRVIQQFLNRRSGGRPAPGLSVAVGIDGELKIAKGFGEAGSGTPATAATVYHIGSLTKQFTAAAVLGMIEDGARAPLSRRPFTLDTPMGEIFEGVERWTAKGEPPITVRSLLTMTSNLPNFTLHPPREVDPWGAVATPKLLAALKRQPPHGWPNTFEYSNTGYFLLARIIEATLATGDGYRASSRDYVRTRVLVRAGLMQTGFVGENAHDSQLAQPHYRRRPAFAQPHWLDGCGDMASNVLDLFAWNRALMLGRVISPTSSRAMYADAARVDPLTYYGMGWFITHENGRDTYYHSGSVPGFTSYNAISRSRPGEGWLSVTLLANSDGVEGLDRLADEIFYIANSDEPAR